MIEITMSNTAFYGLILLVAAGLFVAPTLTLWLRSWEMWGGLLGSSFGSMLFIMAAMTIIISVVAS